MRRFFLCYIQFGIINMYLFIRFKTAFAEIYYNWIISIYIFFMIKKKKKD